MIYESQVAAFPQPTKIPYHILRKILVINFWWCYLHGHICVTGVCGLRQFQFSMHEISPTHSPDVHVSMYAYMYHLSSRCWHVFLASRVVYYGIAYTHYISFGNSSLMLCVPQFLSFELCSIVYWLLSLKVSIPFNYICYKQVVPFKGCS